MNQNVARNCLGISIEVYRNIETYDDDDDDDGDDDDDDDDDDGDGADDEIVSRRTCKHQSFDVHNPAMTTTPCVSKFRWSNIYLLLP